MVTRISVDLTEDVMIANLWNSPAGCACAVREVEPTQVAVVAWLRMSDYPTEEERAALIAALEAVSEKILAAELLSEVQAPRPLAQRAWRLHMNSHLRADPAPLGG